MDAKASLARIVAAGGMVLSVALAHAQVAPSAAPASATPRVAPLEVQRPDRPEAAIVHHTIEDGGSKIDELVVRGELQHVVVTPKVGTTKSYEIIVQRGGRTPPDSTGGATSAVGKRVWNVLAF